MPDLFTATHNEITVPAQLLTGIAEFSTVHGGATAVIEYIGRRGARIVLVGNDGAWGDQIAPATDVARAACTQAGITIMSAWDRDLTERIAPEPRRWHSMKRRVFAR